LFHAGDAGDGCYRVDNGLLKVTMLSPSGSERILAFLGSGAVVGELSMIDGLPRSASVVAVRPAALSFLSRAAFKAFAIEHPELYEYLVMLLSARLRETDAVIAAGSFLPTKGRLACTYSNWRANSVRTPATDVLSSARRLVRAISRQ
jgi:CRP-like cAMP-binding protein